MKLLSDQNLSHKLAARLAAVFPGSTHVRNHGLQTADDLVVWQFAAADGFTIVTRDDDFDSLSFTRGAPPKVVGLTIGNCSTDQIEALLVGRAADIAAFEADASASFLALS